MTAASQGANALGSRQTPGSDGLGQAYSIPPIPPPARMRLIAIVVVVGFTLLAALAPASAQWASQASPTDVELRGLSVVSPRIVWASGQRGTVVHTLDG